MYDQGFGVNKDLKQAENWYTKAVEQNNSQGQYNLAVLYMNSPSDSNEKKDKIMELLEKSAHQNLFEAVETLCVLYTNNDGKPNNLEKALLWYQKGSDLGSAECQSRFGLIYDYGLGVKQDFNKARHYYQLAAKNKNLLSINNLAGFYFWGKGVEKNYDKAMKWYLQAAQAGDATAQANVGFIYQKGLGSTIQNISLAEKWYLKSAHGGFAEAQFNLAILYAQGKGIKQNIVKSLIWLQIYLQQDNIMKYEQARQIKERILKAIPAKQAQWAKQQADQWIIDNPIENIL